MGRRLLMALVVFGFAGWLFGFTAVGDFLGTFGHGLADALRAFAHGMKSS
jgi:hypothetical protein